MFNLHVAAKTQCKRAIIRIDHVVFMDKDNKIVSPRINSTILNVVLTDKSHDAPRHSLYYRVSINGGKWLKPFVTVEWDDIKLVLTNAVFAQFFVPTDFNKT